VGRHDAVLRRSENLRRFVSKMPRHHFTTQKEASLTKRAHEIRPSGEILLGCIRRCETGDMQTEGGGQSAEECEPPPLPCSIALKWGALTRTRSLKEALITSSARVGCNVHTEPI
jgi:hypothetical protein